MTIDFYVAKNNTAKILKTFNLGTSYVFIIFTTWDQKNKCLEGYPKSSLLYSIKTARGNK